MKAPSARPASVAVTPAVGAAIASGDGDLAMLLLAAISVAAGLANLRPPLVREPAQSR